MEIHKDKFSGVEIVGGKEWHVWKDGTLHRFKQHPKKRVKRGRKTGVRLVKYNSS